jgi:hypothetical protein
MRLVITWLVLPFASHGLLFGRRSRGSGGGFFFFQIYGFAAAFIGGWCGHRVEASPVRPRTRRCCSRADNPAGSKSRRFRRFRSRSKDGGKFNTVLVCSYFSCGWLAQL